MVEVTLNNITIKIQVPTVQPSGPGQLWMNNGVLSITPTQTVPATPAPKPASGLDFHLSTNSALIAAVK